MHDVSPNAMMQEKRVFAYYRPFPWDRIGRARTGRTVVERCIKAFAAVQDLRVQQMLVETDPNVRRTLEERVVGGELIRRLRTEEAHGMVVYRLEHAFSSGTEAVHSIERWMDEGLAFYCAQIHGDRGLALSSGYVGHDATALIRSLSELQRTTDLERARQQLLRPYAQERSRGRVPFGFQVVDGRLVEQPDRMERIVQMKRAHRQGKTYRHIAQTHAISVATAHRLVRTDLRKLRRLVGTNEKDDRTAGSSEQR